MNQPTISIDREIGDDEIPPKGHLRIEDIKVLPKMQQRYTVQPIAKIEALSEDLWLENLTDDFWVRQYKTMLTLSDPPPVTVYQVDNELILVDGFHRLCASKKAGRKTIPAIVIKGTTDDAILGSCQANFYYRNGVSQEDKRRVYWSLSHHKDFESYDQTRIAVSIFRENDYSKIGNYKKYIENHTLLDNGDKYKKEGKIRTEYPTKILEEKHKNYLVDLWKNACIPEYRTSKNSNIPYTLNDCAEETGFTEDELKQWIRTINSKGQAIIQGPPGTGKTFLAQKLAKHLISGGNGCSEIIQFHPAYTYEDFIEGIRPQTLENGQLSYSMVPGRFLEFCKKAEKKAESSKNLCVLIIDEINRANLSQVFGELMYLLDERQDTERFVTLASGQQFKIPTNVRIIGTMNTADRSIALVDHALRRRFAFISLEPNYAVLTNYHLNKKKIFPVAQLITVLETINGAIENKHYKLGISFFLKENLAEDIQDIWKMEIEPYLEEYFFDDLTKMEQFSWNNIIKDNVSLLTNPVTPPS